VAYDPDKIIEVATRLKAAREEVAKLEMELRHILAPQVQGQSTLVHPSVPTRVISLLNSNPSKDFSAEDVWKKLDIKESYARPLLSRLVNSKKIEKRGWGVYGAIGGSKQKSLDSLESRPVQ